MVRMPNTVASRIGERPLGSSGLGTYLFTEMQVP
jgi:hypothetical protein